jgi:2'-5' RNA ligase
LTHARDTSPATVDPDARLRLFCALRLPDDVVDDLAAWQLRELRGARAVPPGNLHVTLAFLGGRPAAELGPIAAALRDAAAGAERPELEVRGYRETRSVGMLVCDDDGGRATAFAADLFGRLEALGVYRREGRPWLPHVTVVRFRERPRLRPGLPELGPFSPSDAAVYLSRLHPSGARYEVLETAGLGG